MNYLFNFIVQRYSFWNQKASVLRTLYIHFELFNIYNMEKKDILESLINYYTDGNKAKFAAKLGIKPQTINTWLGRNSFDVELVYSKCEYLSGDWLLSGGDGEMLRATKIIKADNGSVATGDNSSVHGNTTIAGDQNYYGDSCGSGKPSQVVATLTETVATLTRELETSQQQKSNLIRIIDKLTDK